MATTPGAYAPTVRQAITMSNAAQEGGDLIATVIPTPKGLAEGVGKLGAKLAGKEAAKLSEKEAAKLAAKEAEKAAAKKAEEAAAKKAEEEAARKAEKEGKAPEGPGDGAKVKPKKLEEHKPPCFNPYDKPGFKKLSAAEQRTYLENYAKQLGGQQNAINSMTASEFKAARDAFGAVGRNPAANIGQATLRDSFQANIRRSLLNSMIKGGASPAAALSASSAQASSLMGKLAALHEPDMVAGGWFNPTPTSMGRSDVNSSIGGSWNQAGRAAGMQSEAEKAVGQGMGDAKMNVRLEVCRGKG